MILRNGSDLDHLYTHINPYTYIRKTKVRMMPECTLYMMEETILINVQSVQRGHKSVCCMNSRQEHNIRKNC